MMARQQFAALDQGELKAHLRPNSLQLPLSLAYEAGAAHHAAGNRGHPGGYRLYGPHP